MDTVIDKIPETSIDDAIATLTKTTNTVSDVSDEEIIGAPLEDYTIYLVREYEYVTEGWGMFFNTLFGGWGTWIVADQISKSTIKRIMKDKKMQNYIKSAMKARIEKYKKAHKGDKIENGKPNSINLGYGFNKGNGTIRDWMSANKMNMLIDGYTVCLWADSDHIENVGVWIYNETQDKMELLTLPPPKGKELQAFRREWSNPDDE